MQEIKKIILNSDSTVTSKYLTLILYIKINEVSNFLIFSNCIENRKLKIDFLKKLAIKK